MEPIHPLEAVRSPSLWTAAGFLQLGVKRVAFTHQSALLTACTLHTHRKTRQQKWLRSPPAVPRR
eukprot:1109259-Prymnesium_polylepis.1